MPTTARCKAQEGAIAQNQSDIPAETTAIRVPTVDEIVNEQATYTKLCEEQSAVFRENVEEFKREFTLYRESGNVVKSGDSGNWQPAARDRDAFVAEMRRRCQQVPNSIAEQALRPLCILLLLLMMLFPSRVKIYFAAHAILACIVFVDMTRHPEEAQLEILRKSNKKWYSTFLLSASLQRLTFFQAMTVWSVYRPHKRSIPWHGPPPTHANVSSK
jgi:hypothetical protein